MADNTNWKYTIIDTENNETGKIYELDNIYTGIDLINYFGTGSNNGVKLLAGCTPFTHVHMKNGGVRQLKDIRFTEMPLMYIDNYIARDLLIRTIPIKHWMAVTQKSIYIDPKFILVFIDGKYSLDWHCVDSILYLHKKPEKSFEIYLLSNYDYNLQDKTHYYSSQSPAIEFTFNNLRKNQFMEHHLIANDYYIIKTNGVSSFIRKDTVSTRHLLKFNNGKLITSSIVKLYNVVQNQSETYEDVIIRKKLYGGDYSLWAGVDDIYSTSNSSSTLLFDQYGRLIDPISLDWYNRRFAPYGDGYEYVEIQHPSDRVYTGEIYFPAAGHDADEHIRYNKLYETNYKLVYLEGGGTFEYDTYFKKNFETLHLEETIYVKDYTHYVTDGTNRFPIRNNEFFVSTNPKVLYNVEDFINDTMTIDGIQYRIVEETFNMSDIGNSILNTKKGEHLYLDDIILNKAHQNEDEGFDEDIITEITSVQIQSNTSFIRREILTFKKVDGIDNENLTNDLTVEVPKDEGMLVFVDGIYQFRNTYTTSTKTDTDGIEHYYITLDEKFAGDTPETTESHIVTVFYYNVSNLINYTNFTLQGVEEDYLIFDNDFNNLLRKFSKMLPGLLLNDNIDSNVISVLTYIKWNMDINDTEVLEYEDKTMCAFGTKAHPILCALAHKLVHNVINDKNTMIGNLALIRYTDCYINHSLSPVNSTPDKFGLPSYSANSNGVVFTYPEYPSLLDYLVLSFSYVGDNGKPVVGEIPLSFIIGNPLFKGLEFDLFFFEHHSGNYEGTYNFSIDKGHFNSNEQSFVVNNLRKNIYMEHHNAIVTSYINKFTLPHIENKKHYVHFQSIVNANPHFIANTLIKMCENRGYVNNYDTIDNNMFYGSVFVRNFVNDSFERTTNIIPLYNPSWIKPELTVTVKLVDENSSSSTDDIIEDDITDDTPVYAIPEWTVDEYGIECVIPYTTKESENVKVYLLDKAVDLLKETPEETDDVLLEQYLVSNLPGGSITNSEDKIILRFDKVTKTDVNGNVYEWPFDIEELKSSIEKKYMYIKIIDIDEDYFDNETYSDSYRASIFCLEKEFNRYSSMVFDKSGYLISPDSIDWTYTTFNYPMEENMISILPLNSKYPAIIGDLYDSSIQKEKIMSLCLNDVIQIDGELHRIGGDLQENIDLNADENGWDIAVPENGWELAPDEYDENGEPLRNRFMPPDGYYDSIFVENTGLINNSVVPVDYNITETSEWRRLNNSDYVYWIIITDENEDSMRIVVEPDDFIQNNTFIFVNGIKALDEDVILNTQKNYYQIYNYSKYKKARYCNRKYSKLNESVMEHLKLLYVDSSNKYTFNETDRIVTLSKNSGTTNAVYKNPSDLTDDTLVVAYADEEATNEIVIYNYNPEDIEYCIIANYDIPVREVKFEDDTVEYRITINETFAFNEDFTEIISKTNKNREPIAIADNKFTLYGVNYQMKYDTINGETKLVAVRCITDNIRYKFDDYYDYDLRKYSLVFVNGVRVRDFIVDENEIVLDLNDDDNLEIYIFKKFDYNWIDEVKYDQYRDNRYFNVHNLKTVRMI